MMELFLIPWVEFVEAAATYQTLQTVLRAWKGQNTWYEPDYVLKDYGTAD